MKRTQGRIRKGIIVLFWLGVWQIAAVRTANPVLLAGPVRVLCAFAENLARPDFFLIVFHSMTRIGLGFFLAFFAGMILGGAAYRLSWVEELLSPVMTALKSVPVASFVVLLLIWFGAGRLSFLISFLIVFPHVYGNTIAGLRSTDEKLLEMARVFGIGRGKRLFYIYRPALAPYLDSCLKFSLGMSWKSGVAAELIGLPESSLGERLYMSKIYLDTAGLFAWTLTIVLCSFLFEKAVLGAFRQFARWRPYPVPGPGSRGRLEPAADRARETLGQDIHAVGLEKAYQGQMVLRDLDLKMEAGGRYLLMAPSGAGKTTLLRILTGLEKADRGEVCGMPPRVGMVFQEDRLCEEYDAVCNIMLGMCRAGGAAAAGGGMTGKQLKEYVRAETRGILPEDCLTKPVKNLSGGMRRRVALLRAVLSGAEVLVLDEPFTGLDEANRLRSAAYLVDKTKGRTILAATHRVEDVELLQGVRIGL